MSKKHEIKGKFEYNDPDKISKKKKKKLDEKAFRERTKAIAKQCECNHLDSKHGKTHFTTDDTGNYKICKICGGRLIANPDMLTRDAVSQAVDVIYTVFGHVRRKMVIDDKVDDKITNALKIVMTAPDMYDRLVKYKGDRDNDGGKKGKKKDKKKDKNNFSRVSY